MIRRLRRLARIAAHDSEHAFMAFVHGRTIAYSLCPRLSTTQACYHLQPRGKSIEWETCPLWYSS
jgi:hypothetical protein